MLFETFTLSRFFNRSVSDLIFVFVLARVGAGLLGSGTGGSYFILEGKMGGLPEEEGEEGGDLLLGESLSEDDKSGNAGGVWILMSPIARLDGGVS